MGTHRLKFTKEVRKEKEKKEGKERKGRTHLAWQSSLKERVRALTKIVNIAEHLRRYNNFNSLVSVLAGINNAATHRLKFTKEVRKEEKKEGKERKGRTHLAWQSSLKE